MNKIVFLILSTVLVIFAINFQSNTTQVEPKTVSEEVTENLSVSVEVAEIAPKRRMYVTHYCSCVECTGYEHTDYVFGAEGTELIPMVSVASNEYDFGTQLLVTHDDGSQEVWIVQDRGAFDDGQLDLYVGTDHQAALSIPNEYVDVQVYERDHFEFIDVEGE